MILRRVLLRIMLGSLAVAAVLGAIAVLAMRSQSVERIVGTALLTAIAAGIMLPASIYIDKPKRRYAGLFAVGLILVEYLLSLVLIWDIYSDTARVGLTCLFIAAVGVPMFCLLLAQSNASARIAGFVGLGLAVVELGVLMAAVWSGSSSFGDDHLYGNAAAGAIFIPMIIGSFVGAGTGDGRWWRWIGVVLAAISTGVTCYAIWNDLNGTHDAYVLLVTASAVFAYANVVMECKLKPGQRWIRWGTLAAVLITACCVDASILKYGDTAEDPLTRIAAAAGIVGGCGTLAMLILTILNRRLKEDVNIAEAREVSLTCPICAKKQMIGVGGANCINCGLRIVIQLEEPRCAKCGYLLYHNKSDRCPECGTGIFPSPMGILPMV